MREFVRSHPSYAHDSVVSQEINFDLVHAIDEIERGVRHEPDLLGRDYVGSDALEIELTAAGSVSVTQKEAKK